MADVPDTVDAMNENDTIAVLDATVAVAVAGELTALTQHVMNGGGEHVVAADLFAVFHGLQPCNEL